MDKTLRYAYYLLDNFSPLSDVLAEDLKHAEGPFERAGLVYSAAKGIVERIKVYEEAWRNHPDYEWVQETSGIPSKPWNPQAVMIVRHPPGKDMIEESYIISDLNDLLTNKTVAWANKTLGEFEKVVPIWPDCPVHWCRQMYISWSFKGSGFAYNARMELKRFLPRKYHRLISKARSHNSGLKSKSIHLLQRIPDKGATSQKYLRWIKDRKNNPKPDLPEWFTNNTNHQLNRESFIKQYSQEEKAEGLTNYIEWGDFYECATGKVHPHEVKNLINHQLSFDSILTEG